MVRNQLLMNRWRNRSTAVSLDGQRAKTPYNYRAPSFTSVFFSPGWRGREKQRQLTPLNNSVLAKNPWRSWIFSAKLKSARFFISHEEPPGWPRRFWLRFWLTEDLFFARQLATSNPFWLLSTSERHKCKFSLSFITWLFFFSQKL